MAKSYKSYNNKNIHGKIYCEDALEFLSKIEDNTAVIVFLDPPFNLGKKYCSKNSKLDSKPEEIYEKWLRDVLKESSRILKPGGTLYLYHIPKWAMRLGSYLEEFLKFHHWIAISMKNGFVRGNNLYPAHYSLLMYTKGDPKFFNRPKLAPTRCRHCNELIKDYGGYKSIIESKGINLSDFWDDVYPVRHQNKKYRSANELPEIILNRIVSISGNENSLFVDPFVGSGTSIIAALKSNMKFLCCDLLEKNCQIVNQRIIEYRDSSKRGKTSNA